MGQRWADRRGPGGVMENQKVFIRVVDDPDQDPAIVSVADDGAEDLRMTICDQATDIIFGCIRPDPGLYRVWFTVEEKRHDTERGMDFWIRIV
jgi:hypothetical protein